MAEFKNRIVGTGEEDPEQLLANPNNWRIHPDDQKKVLGGIFNEVGWVQNIIVNRTTGHIIDGHLRAKLAIEKNQKAVPVVYVDLSEEEELLILASLDPIAGLAGTDQEMLDNIIGMVEASDQDLQGFLDGMRSEEEDQSAIVESAKDRLRELFLIPPFTILDARQGYWQERKKDWLAIGLKSEIGRSDNLTYAISCQPTRALTRKTEIEAAEGKMSWREFAERYPEEITFSGTSIFDPVMCEIAYRWFCPKGGTIIDPFAGGSVRGAVAGMLGYTYTGVDLRPEQVRANNMQWAEIGATGGIEQQADTEDHMPELTRVERRGEYYFKRDDTFAVAGVRGGKVRSCWHLAQGAEGLVTAGSRSSPQVNIVARIAKRLGIPCRVHVPRGTLKPEVQQAAEAGAEIFQHKAGYNNVIIARAREDAVEQGYREIPFGMECEFAVRMTSQQTENLPKEAKRIVVPVGSGMSLAGILRGMADAGNETPVIGVKVGADPEKRLDEYAPKDWRNRVTLVDSGLDYHDEAKNTEFEGLKLDPIYEAKCIPFLEPGDCLWTVGIRRSAVGEATHAPTPTWITGNSLEIKDLAPGGYDMIFSCPPYADLEKYSDDPEDLSNMPYPQFLDMYRQIIADTCELLNPDSFAVFVVGEVRAPNGTYRNLVGETINAFTDAGLSYYNEAVLITQTGSVAMRAANMFLNSRKLAKTHQNALVFAKGNPPKITIEGISAATADAFGDERKLLEHYSKVLVFAKGDAKAAAQEMGPPDIDDPVLDAIGA